MVWHAISANFPRSHQYQGLAVTRQLTVIVPCRNERLNIGSCIESFFDLADEILIADSLSDDDTVEICSRYQKVRVVQREYRTSGDFKNWAIPQAKHEWVLLLDADERVTPELAEEVRQVLQAPQYDGYWIYRDNHFMGHPLHYGDARTDKVLRLFRRDISRYEGPSDHGEVQVESGRVSVLQNRMLHYTVWDYDQLFRKYDRYTRLQAEQWHGKGRDASYASLLLRPAWRFFREYILQLGILDGKAGLQLSWLAAFYSFTKQARLWQMNHALPQPPAAAGTAGYMKSANASVQGADSGDREPILATPDQSAGRAGAA